MQSNFIVTPLSSFKIGGAQLVKPRTLVPLKTQKIALNKKSDLLGEKIIEEELLLESDDETSRSEQILTTEAPRSELPTLKPFRIRRPKTNLSRIKP